MSNLIHQVAQEALLARQRIEKIIYKTPLEYSPYLSDRTGSHVYLKLENVQLTGSFKVRGALNKLLSIPNSMLKNGVVTASTGNHAAAVAYATQQRGCKATIVMPTNVSQTKSDQLRHFRGLEVRYVGNDSLEAELAARQIGQEEGLPYISPYNDWQVLGGQGTIGYELLEQLPDIDAVFVPVGGGGLISGIAGAMLAKKASMEIIGCQPKNSAVMYHSLEAGKVLAMESKPTISDGTAGGVEADAVTFKICRNLVERFHLVEESEIMEALRLMVTEHQYMVEGAAGLSIAALIKNIGLYKGKNVVLIICGNKMSRELLKEVLLE